MKTPPPLPNQGSPSNPSYKSSGPTQWKDQWQTKQENPQQPHPFQQQPQQQPSSYSPNTWGQPAPQPSGSSKNVLLIILGAVSLISITALITFLIMWKSDSNDVNSEPAQTPLETYSQPEVIATDSTYTSAYSSQPNTLGPGWAEGKNLLSGTFSYNGSNYGFNMTVELSNGNITQISYSASGSGAVTKISGTRQLTDDGHHLYIDGVDSSGYYTYIDAYLDSSGNAFTGNMTRGDHNGTCSIYFR